MVTFRMPVYPLACYRAVLNQAALYQKAKRLKTNPWTIMARSSLANTLIFASAISVILGSTMTASYAKPDLTTPVDMTLLHTDNTGYRFVSQRFDQSTPSISDAPSLMAFAKPRHYQVWLAIPKHYRADNPNNKVLYMLDGNAVIEELNQGMLRELTNGLSSVHSAKTAPVLVMIGYQTPYRFDLNARAYDYTPPLLITDHDNNPPSDAFKEQNRERLNGGAEHFYHLIEQKIKPWVYGQLGQKPQTEGLWGHSYGGLFVLYNLFEHPKAYDYYFSADPSLWWHKGEILNYWQAYQQHKRPADVQIQLTFSSASQSINGSKAQDQNQNRAAPLSKPEFAQALCAQFSEQCQYQSYAQSHGELFPTSLKQALEDF